MIKSGFNVASVRLLLTGRTACGNHMTKGRFFKIGWSQKVYREAQIKSYGKSIMGDSRSRDKLPIPDRPYSRTLQPF